MEIVWIIVAFVFGLLARFIQIPTLVGYLAAGVTLKYFGAESGPLLDQIAHLGVLLLLFSVGLKIRFKNLFRLEILGGSLLHLTVIGVFYFLILTSIAALSKQVAVIIAVALGFSSTVLAAKVLEQKRELRSFHGRVAIGILVMQDLVAVILLSMNGTHSPSPWALLILLLPLLRPVVYKLLDVSGHDELLVLFGLLLVVAVAGAGFESMGMSTELGALLLGALLANHGRASELSSSLWSIKEILLIGFFLQIGMSGLPDVTTLLAALGLVALLPLKAALFFFVLIAFRLRARSAFLTAMSLATYSEFGLIIAHLGVSAQWLDQQWMVVLAFAVVVSFIVAAPLNHFAHRLYERFERRLSAFETKRRHPDDEPIYLGAARFMIVGMGRVGTGAYDFLTQRGQRCVGFDSDPGQVAKHLQAHRRVVYADSEDPGLWHNVHLDHIEAVLLAVPDLEANLIAVKQLRKRGFTGLISATAVYPEHVQAITAAGADMAYNYFDEVGVGFAEHVWENFYPLEPPKARV